MAKNGVMRYPPFAHLFLAGAVLAMRGRRAGEGRGSGRRHSTARCKSTRLPLAEVRRKARLGLGGAGRGGGLLPERRPASSQKTARGSAGAAGAPRRRRGERRRARLLGSGGHARPLVPRGVDAALPLQTVAVRAGGKS